MSIHRYAARADQNAPELVRLARKLGWELYSIREPCDYIGIHPAWPGLKGIELKSPNGKLKPSQSAFQAALQAIGDDLLVWRLDSDVIRDSTRKRRVN